MNFYFPFSVKQMKKKNWFGIFPKLVRQNNFVIFSFSIAEPHLNAISFGLNPTNDFGFFFFWNFNWNSKRIFEKKKYVKTNDCHSAISGWNLRHSFNWKKKLFRFDGFLAEDKESWNEFSLKSIRNWNGIFRCIINKTSSLDDQGENQNSSTIFE